ncbi:MAG: hypothetical protein ITG00_05770 [Flavobacterium sp.]|nr:hypothetical protein [Flavobacterium sp.]
MDIKLPGVQNREDLGSQLTDEREAVKLTTINEKDECAEQPPLRKIHTKHHSCGRYKMFSNYSSAQHTPWTSTGA